MSTLREAMESLLLEELWKPKRDETTGRDGFFASLPSAGALNLSASLAETNSGWVCTIMGGGSNIARVVKKGASRAEAVSLTLKALTKALSVLK